MVQKVTVQPDDTFNRKLVAHLHPAEWVNPEPADRYNLVVIGAGTAGLVTAAGAAGLGAKVALIERHLMGGDCLNVGCVPSKALLAAARLLAGARRAASMGMVASEAGPVSFATVMENMRRLRAGIAPHDAVQRFKSLGVDVFLGQGCFTGRRTVQVADRTLQFSRACIATGGRAAAPPLQGLEKVEYLTNETLFSLTRLPRRLGVIGAGPIGCEMAQAFARFGSQVTLVEAMHGVLPREDREASEVIKAALLAEGVKVMCCGKQLKLERSPGGKLLSVDSHESHYDIEVDEILVAVGRAANVEGLGLSAAGVTAERSGVVVNDRLQTSNPRVYAAGDVCSRYKFTHAADALARIVIQNALFSFLPVKAKASALTMPWCTYTSPELAHVGPTVQEMEEKNIAYDTITVKMNDVDRAVLEGEADGLVKIHVARGSDRILAASVVASHAGDLISEITLGMVHKIGLKGYSATIHPYPTQAEVLRKAGDAFKRRQLTPRTRRILAKIMAWQR